jgi:hypothetical protein
MRCLTIASEIRADRAVGPSGMALAGIEEGRQAIALLQSAVRLF